jgi:hypothetical protein
MPAERVVSLKAPLGGVFKRTNLESRPSTSFYDSRDFWPIDASVDLDRPAIRPGYASYFTGNTSQYGCNLIATLNVAPSETSQRLLMTAAGGNLYKWVSGSPSSLGSGIDTGRNVQSAPYLGTLFIANDTPKLYNHDTTTYGTWTATGGKGSVPAGCRLICHWANRIVMAGDPDAPHLWYMGRIGDPYDWLFAADDDGSPVAGTDIEGGQISEPITSLIPHNRACIIFGCANSLTVLRNNPVAGGTMELISHVVGPVNPTAWCKTADDWTYFLTRDGLYRMPPGCGTTPTSISREIIPGSLLSLDGIADKVYMEYDVRFRCIHIYVIGTHAQAFHYFPYLGSREDLGKAGAFCPVTAPDTSILAIGRFDPIEDTDKSGVLIGTSGYLKRLDRTAALGGASLAFAKFNPFKLSSTLGEKAKIMRVMLKFGDNSNDASATIDLYAAGSGEAVVAMPTSRKARALLSSLYDRTNHINYAWHPTIGGVAGFLHITQADTSKHISYEDGNIYLRAAGRERR